VREPKPMKTTGRGDVANWSDAPLVFTEMVACPCCGTTRRPIIIRSERGGDGSRSRRQVCKVCSRRWVLVIEPPAEFSGDVPVLGKTPTVVHRIHA